MRGDPVDSGLGLITSWPLVLLILVLVALGLVDVNPGVAAILGRALSWF
jgi:hypothetical protein